MESNVTDRRRKILSTAVKALTLVLVASLIVPFAISLTPSDKAESMGGPIRVDISNLDSGEIIEVDWRGSRHVFLRRTEAEIQSLEDQTTPFFVPYVRYSGFDPYSRSVREDVFVFSRTCPHRSCYVEIADARDFRSIDFDYLTERIIWDPCHQWFFDLAGRFVGSASEHDFVANQRGIGDYAIPVPDYRFLDATTIELGRK